MQPPPLEQQIRVHPVALRHLGNRDARLGALLNHRQSLLRRERAPRLVAPVQADARRWVSELDVHLSASGHLASVRLPILGPNVSPCLGGVHHTLTLKCNGGVSESWPMA